MKKAPKKIKNVRLIATKRAIRKKTARRLNIPVSRLSFKDELLHIETDGRWVPVPGFSAVLR